MLGKHVANRVYAHTSLLPQLPESLQEAVARAVEFAGIQADVHFNVARIDLLHEEVSLLNYPGIFGEPFPALDSSVRVHLPTGQISTRIYRTSLNPPVLHRKELLLPDSHPHHASYCEITELADSLGLFTDPSRIGFKRQWEDLVASRGYEVTATGLAPLSNLTEDLPEAFTDSLDLSVARHRTALSRTFLSAPVQSLLRHRVLEPGHSVFDYGCGKGDDLSGLASLGYAVSGWDPHFRPDGIREVRDIVNLGFVINVIENLEERIEALSRAYALAKVALSVAAILPSSMTASGRPYRDGCLTSRGTFQKFYSQSELQVFIEAVLEEQAFPIAPGIFFVFRDRYAEQRFLSRRQVDPSRVPRLLARRPAQPRARDLRREGKRKEAAALLAQLEPLWTDVLTLGRLPEIEDIPNAATYIELVGSWKRCINTLLNNFDASELERAAAARMDELRLFFAMVAFEKRRNRALVDPRLRRDVRAFFGSVATAESEGMLLLKRAADPSAIREACTLAASQGFGWLDGDQSLQLHTSLVPRLDTVLRAYIGCALTLYGAADSADLIKIHIQSGKLTLMSFDAFSSSPVPRMTRRIKIKLRDQDLDVFDYGGDFPPTPLYFKSRYINEEFPGYPDQLSFDSSLQELGIVEPVGYGPSEADFATRLRRARRRIDGMRLAPADDCPNLDELCGKVFQYRQLVECGETWERLRINNVPQQPATYNALYELAVSVLDPVVEYFGGIRLTYGFASPALTKAISRHIDPKVDQHASCELNARGSLVCPRRGAAVDFIVDDEDMRDVARWINEHCDFDRMYFYGSDRPLHVSVGPESLRSIYEMTEKAGRRIPRRLSP